MKTRAQRSASGYACSSFRSPPVPRLPLQCTAATHSRTCHGQYFSISIMLFALLANMCGAVSRIMQNILRQLNGATGKHFLLGNKRLFVALCLLSVASESTNTCHANCTSSYQPRHPMLLKTGTRHSYALDLVCLSLSPAFLSSFWYFGMDQCISHFLVDPAMDQAILHKKTWTTADKATFLGSDSSRQLDADCAPVMSKDAADSINGHWG
jgi:hypothetical protein